MRFFASWWERTPAIAPTLVAAWAVLALSGGASVGGDFGQSFARPDGSYWHAVPDGSYWDALPDTYWD